MNLKQFIAVCLLGVSLTAGASEFPFGSLEKFWDYAATNTTQIRFDVKGVTGDQWVTLVRVNVTYNHAVHGPLEEFARREFTNGILAEFAKKSDAELRQYDEFSSFLWCLSPKYEGRMYQISWRYTLDEVDGKLVVPEHIRNPVLSLQDTGYRPGKVPGLQSAELFIRKGGSLTEYQESWPFSPNGAHLLVDEEYLVVPMPLATGANGGELVLYFTDGTHKVIDLATGDVATSYPPLDQPEVIFGIPYWYSTSVKPQAVSAKSVTPVDIVIVKGRGRDFSVEYTSDFKSWDVLTEVFSSRAREVVGDYAEASHRFYRVRLHD